LVDFRREHGITRGVIAGPPDSVWRAVRAMLADVGIPIKLDDRADGVIGNERFRAVRRLGKVPLSRLFSCGEGLTGPNADAYHVFIRFVVRLAPVPTAARTRFEMRVYAEAVDVPGGRPERLPCTTSGRLELTLVDRLNQAFPGTK
jgi:hypothetical protein